MNLKHSIKAALLILNCATAMICNAQESPNANPTTPTPTPNTPTPNTPLVTPPPVTSPPITAPTTLLETIRPSGTVTVAPTVYDGQEAVRFSDGRTEAIIVPGIGRVMSYRLVGGANLLWNTPLQQGARTDEYVNWGGDKTWLGPHSQWITVLGRLWPPDLRWDMAPHQAEVLEGKRLRTTGPAWPGFGARIIREF